MLEAGARLVLIGIVEAVAGLLSDVMAGLVLWRADKDDVLYGGGFTV